MNTKNNAIKMAQLNAIDKSIAGLNTSMEGLKELRELINPDAMVALNPTILADASKKVVINSDNVAVVNGEALTDELSVATTSEYASSHNFCRYVMRQMFNMLDYKGYNNRNFYGHWVDPNGYAAYMRHHMTYAHQFNFLIGDTTRGDFKGHLFVLAAKLRENDPTALFYEKAWGKERIVAMLNQYVTDAATYFDYIAHKHAKNPRNYRTGNYSYGHRGYVPINTFRSVLQERIDGYINRIRRADNYLEVRKILRRFMDQDYIRIRGELNREFVDSYKLFGAYWTMQNLIGWHGCVVYDNGIALSRQASMEKLNTFTLLADTKGFQLFGMLKELIADNNYSIENDPYIINYYAQKSKKTA